MSLTITLDGTGVIAYCDALSDTAGGTWSEVGGGSIEATTDAYLCGSSCIGGAYSNKTGYQLYTLPSTLDFDTGGTQEGELIYIWIQTSTIYLHESIANGGLTINVGTGSGANFRTFMIAAGDATNGWTGDWKCFIIDPTKPGTVADTGTFDVGSVSYIWVDLDITALAKGNNILIDMITCAKGIRVSGTSTTPWQDIVSYCNDFTTRAWGQVQQREGIIYVYGTVTFEEGAAANSSFQETSAPVIQFGTSEYYYSGGWELSVPTNYCGIVIEDSASYTTTFDDGVIVGSDGGRAGATLIGHDDLLVSADLFGGANAGSVTRLYGTNFRKFLGGINMGDDAQHLAYGVNFIKCAQFDPVGAPVLRNLTFAESIDNDAALLWNDDINISEVNFIACSGAAIEHPVSGIYEHSSLTMSNNVYDVYNSSGGAVVITKVGTSDGSTYDPSGSVVSFQSSVDITIKVQDTSTNPIPSCQVAVYNSATRAEIMNEDTRDVAAGSFVIGTKYIITAVGTTDFTAIGAASSTVGVVFTATGAGSGTGTASDGVAFESYTGSTPIDIEVRCRKSSAGASRYQSFSTLGTLSGDFSLLVTMQTDTTAT